MPKVDRYAEGQFCWFEVAGTDTAAAKPFFTELFGWQVDAQDLPGGGTYDMFMSGDSVVGAAMDMSEEERASGAPPHFNLYINSASADDAARRIVEAGGSIMAEPFDVMDVGRMLVARDPVGAVFCVWEAKSHTGTGVWNDDNAPSWPELWTADMQKAADFYSKVFGWNPQQWDQGEGEYTVFMDGEQSRAGMMPLPQRGMPPVWFLYLQVSDASATAEKAKSLGGQVLFGPDAAPGVGTFVHLADPQGAAFGIIQPEPQS